MEIQTKYSDSGKEIIVNGVNVDWPFFVEALGECDEDSVRMIQHYLLLLAKKYDEPIDEEMVKYVIALGWSVLHPFVDYIEEINAKQDT